MALPVNHRVVVTCLSLLTPYLLSLISCLLSLVSYLLSLISYLFVSHLLSDVCSFSSFVTLVTRVSVQSGRLVSKVKSFSSESKQVGALGPSILIV